MQPVVPVRRDRPASPCAVRPRFRPLQAANPARRRAQQTPRFPKRHDRRSGRIVKAAGQDADGGFLPPRPPATRRHPSPAVRLRDFRVGGQRPAAPPLPLGEGRGEGEPAPGVVSFSGAGSCLGSDASPGKGGRPLRRFRATTGGCPYTSLCTTAGDPRGRTSLSQASHRGQARGPAPTIPCAHFDGPARPPSTGAATRLHPRCVSDLNSRTLRPTMPIWHARNPVPIAADWRLKTGA